MHIAMLTSEYAPSLRGGLGTYVQNLASELAKHIEVSVINWGSPRRPSMPTCELLQAVRVVRVPEPLGFADQSAHFMMANFYYLVGLLKLSRRHPVDIIPHDISVAFAGLAAKNILRRPLVSTIHQSVPTSLQGENDEFHQELRAAH